MLEKEKQALAELCGKLHTLGQLAGSEGNVSLRTPTGEIVLTPSGKHKGTLRGEDMMVVDLQGNLLEGTGKVTKEFPMHRMIYEQRPEVNCVVHSHPVYGCVYAILGQPIPEDYLLQTKLMVGKIGVASYAPAGSQALVEEVRPHAKDCNLILLRNHGVVVCGKTIEDTLCRCETAENIAHSCLLADLMGGAKPIPGEGKTEKVKSV